MMGPADSSKWDSRPIPFISQMRCSDVEKARNLEGYLIDQEEIPTRHPEEVLYEVVPLFEEVEGGGDRSLEASVPFTELCLIFQVV